jgi:hypothetical protein
MLAAQLAITSTGKARIVTLMASSDFRVPSNDTFYQSMVHTGAPLASSTLELESKVNSCIDSEAGVAVTAPQVACSFAAVVDIVSMSLCVGQHSEDILKAETKALASRLGAFGVMLKASLADSMSKKTSKKSDSSDRSEGQGWLESSSRYQETMVAVQKASPIVHTNVSDNWATC